MLIKAQAVLRQQVLVSLALLSLIAIALAPSSRLEPLRPPRWLRSTSPPRARARPSLSIATGVCCVPSPCPTGGGGCRRRHTRSIRAIVAMLIACEDGRFYAHRGVDASRAVAGGLPVACARPCCVGRLDANDAGRAADRAAPRALARCKAAPDRARARDRAGVRQARRPRPLSDAGALRRQSRRRPRRLARLFRQGAAETLDRRGGAPRRPAAVAGSATPGSCARGRAGRARSGARPRRRPWNRQRRRHSGRQARAGPDGAEADASLAAHAAEEAIAADPEAKTIRLAIDAPLQAKLEALAKESVARLGPKLSAAMVVIDNRPARSAPGSAPPIPTTLRATARSTCRASRARRARR